MRSGSAVRRAGVPEPNTCADAAPAAMNDVAARYEFRVFAPQLNRTEKLMRAMAQHESSGVSSETYLLDCSAVPEKNIKIRRDRLELKRLVERWQGLERWQPAGTWEFPVSRETLHVLWSDEVLKATRPGTASLALDELLALADGSALLRRADVYKRRYRYTFGACSAEIDRLLVDGKPLESCAVESRDPQAVLEAVGRLRLTGEDNRSYAQMLCEAAREHA